MSDALSFSSAESTAAGMRAASYLHTLNAFGPRLTGSPGAARAASWALDVMNAAGLAGVHAEPWTLAEGWQRGSAKLRLLGSSAMDIPAVSYGWTGSTHSPVEADLLQVSYDTPPSPSWKGRILLIAPESKAAESRAFYTLEPFIQSAQKRGALAVLVPDLRPSQDTLHTGPLSFPFVTTRLPVLTISSQSAASLRQQLETARSNDSARVRLGLSVLNTFTPEVSSTNLIGEIRGMGANAENDSILVGAHLDSWDLSPGVTDDGYGVALVLALANLLVRRHCTPRHTIRFALFTGEEQGLLGSAAYVRAHPREIETMAMALVLDWGDGRIAKLPVAGHPELMDPLQSFLQTAGLGDAVAVTNGYLQYTDAFSFTSVGVAGLAPFQDSPLYETLAHSSKDVLATTNTSTLKFNLNVVAALVLGVANAEHPVAVRWSAAHILDELDRIHTPQPLIDQVQPGPVEHGARFR